MDLLYKKLYIYQLVEDNIITMVEIKRRPATLFDFIALKDYKPFSDWRRVSKTINFSLIFGASAMSFMSTLQDSGYLESECDEYINVTGNQAALQDLLNEQKLKGVRGLNPTKCKFLLTATLMRNAYLDKYKGLMERIIREHKFAFDHGYIRTFYGPVRHLNELLFMEYDRDEEALVGGDKCMWQKAFSHLKNEACNSGVQTQEARIIFPTWAHIRKYYKEWHLKSFIWNSTHDSFDACVWYDEVELMVALVNACGSWKREPVNGIHMKFDGELSDISTPEKREATYYKHGVGVKPIPIEEALKNYNEAHGTHWEWHGCEC